MRCAVGLRRQRARQAERAGPVVAGLLWDQVDHAAQRFRAVQCRQWAADDLHALNGREGQPAVLVVRVADHVVAGADAPSVDQCQGVLALQAAQSQCLASAHLACAEGDAGCIAHGVQQVRGVALGERFGGDDGDAGGRGARILLGHRGRDGDGGQGLRHGFLCERGQRERGRQSGGAGQGWSGHRGSFMQEEPRWLDAQGRGAGRVRDAVVFKVSNNNSHY